jgi:hypothetical protein
LGAGVSGTGATASGADCGAADAGAARATGGGNADNAAPAATIAIQRVIGTQTSGPATDATSSTLAGVASG